MTTTPSRTSSSTDQASAGSGAEARSGVDAGAGAEAGAVSILNDVLGPVMRGPSSSHTAASWRLGRQARAFFPGELQRVRITFRENQTFALTFRQQRSDLAFHAGLLGLDVEDPDYDRAFELAALRGLSVEFGQGVLAWAEHPNGLEIEAQGPGHPPLTLRGASVGGGSIRILGIDGWPVLSDCSRHELLVLAPSGAQAALARAIAASPGTPEIAERLVKGDRLFWRLVSPDPPGAELRAAIKNAGASSFTAPPVGLAIRGGPLFEGASGALAWCRENQESLGQAALHYEAALTGLTVSEIEARLDRLAGIMFQSIEDGLKGTGAGLRILTPSAASILKAENDGRLAFGGPPARTAARALAAMESCSAGGLVVAAPTAGSAGILPAVLAAIRESAPNDPGIIRRALAAGAAVGLAFAQGATFAAEIGGCQVEVGASAAMAAGAAASAFGASPAQVFQAASITIQNYMGLICDPVKGYVELPCQIRNALAASSALTAADLVIGGYLDPAPFDETVAATISTGLMLPIELRCTGLGGLAACPSLRD